MDRTQLKYFVEVIESGSISKAAASLYVSQPNLSRVMHAIETEMGKELLIRGNRGIMPTKTGEQLYYYARSLLNQFDLLEQLKNIDEEVAYSKLAISVFALFIKDDLLLKYYEQANSSQSEIQLIETTAEKVVENVSSTACELGILVLNSYQLTVFKRIMEIKDIHVDVLDEGPLSIHLSEKHPLAVQDEVSATQLLPYPYLHIPDDFYSNLSHPLNVDGVQISSFPRTIIMNNYHSLLNMLNHTDCFILGHPWQKTELMKSHVKTLKLIHNTINKHLVIIYRKKQLLSDEAELFLKIFKKDYHVS